MEFKNLQMVISSKVNIRKEGSTVKENIFGQMVHYMMASLSMDIGMAREVGDRQEKQQIYMLEYIRMIKSVDMDGTFGLMAVSTKETSRMTSSKFLE